MNTVTRYKAPILASVFLLGYAYFTKDLFWVVVLFYGLGIHALLTYRIPKKLRTTLAIVIWVAFFAVSGLLYYANHYFPHGPKYDTGDVVCQNDDRGPCAEKYVEDLHELNIPEWGKFFKSSGGELSWMALLFAGIVVSAKSTKEED